MCFGVGFWFVGFLMKWSHVACSQNRSTVLSPVQWHMSKEAGGDSEHRQGCGLLWVRHTVCWPGPGSQLSGVAWPILCHKSMQKSRSVGAATTHIPITLSQVCPQPCTVACKAQTWIFGSQGQMQRPNKSQLTSWRTLFKISFYCIPILC